MNKRKANNTFAFLRRNIHSSNETCYQSLVRPYLEYASTYWDPHTKSNIKSLEMVQHGAARFVSGNYADRLAFEPLWSGPCNKGKDRWKRWWCTISLTTLLPLAHQPFFISMTRLQEATAWDTSNHTLEPSFWGNQYFPLQTTSGTSLQPPWLLRPPWRPSRPE